MGRARRLAGAATLALGFLGAPDMARADGYPPFYGYSGYFGGPATYFTPDTDVQQATTIRDGDLGFGVRTYYGGGPFWGYRPTRVRAAYAPRHRRAARTAALRRKG